MGSYQVATRVSGFTTVHQTNLKRLKNVSNLRPEEYAEWSERVANWDTIVQYDIRNIINHYSSEQGISRYGIFGFCWGGKISTMAATHVPEIKAAGLVHPSSVTNDMAQNVQAPMYLFPCLDDPDFVSFSVVLFIFTN